MNKTLAVTLWAVVWLVGALSIGFVSGVVLPPAAALVVSVVGGLAWGYFMATILLERILRY